MGTEIDFISLQDDIDSNPHRVTIDATGIDVDPDFILYLEGFNKALVISATPPPTDLAQEISIAVTTWIRTVEAPEHFIIT